jgi:uncharacterized repeat protein (TIGR02543 family)
MALTLWAGLPLQASATSTGTSIDLADDSIANGTTGTGWSYNNNVYTITNGANVTITGETTTKRIEVAESAEVTIALNGASITGPDVADQAPITVKSGATLILTVTGENSLTAQNVNAGLRVEPGAFLTIEGSGKLTAQGGTSGDNGGAGIGGMGQNSDEALSTGTITIQGNGEVKAFGGIRSAGMGSGGYNNSKKTYSGTIIISGGIVTAQGGQYAAGIGGCPDSANTGSITINNGMVTASGNQGAGIGGGYAGASGTITISGGTVTAYGGQYGAGIGGGFGGEIGIITINDGTVNATGGQSAAGIGGGANGKNGAVIKINGGTVIAQGGNAGIGNGNNNSGSTLDITNAIVFATSVTSGTTEVGRTNALLVINNTTTFYDSTGSTTGTNTVTLTGDYTIPADKTLTVPTNKILVFDTDASLNILGALNIQGTLTNNGMITNNGTITGNAVSGNPVRYRYADANGGSTLTPQDKTVTVITGNYGDLSLVEDEWYLIKDTATITNRIAVEATGEGAYLILANGSHLDAKKGIGVAGTDKLTIYAQPADSIIMGKLTAVGDSENAGIGGFQSSAVGAITINGGTVNSTGGYNGAGIGGGNGGAGGTIVINGGTVIATGDGGAEGIGAGSSGTGGTLDITDAIVFASPSSTTGTANVGRKNALLVTDSVTTFYDPEGLTIGTNSVTLTGNYVIPEGITLTIPEGKTLTLAESATLTVYGTVINKGVIVNRGTLTTSGTGVLVHKDVTYIDETGELRPTEESVNVIQITSQTNLTLTDGWYIVTGDITITNRIAVNATGLGVHLILADGAHLDAKAGINVAGGDSPNKLTIYAQSTEPETMGRLTATGGNDQAGIGGEGGQAGGAITINGGTVIAIGGSGSGDYFGAAGIGGGNYGAGGDVTINGGIVNASGSERGAGIGGGRHGAGGNVRITGGTVIARGGTNEGVGIGAGNPSSTTGTLTLDGDAIVIALGNYKTPGVSDLNTSTRTSGILLINNPNTATFYGDSVTLKADATFPENKTLIIPVDATLTVPTGKTLIIPEGTKIDVQGTLINEGIIINNGAITGTGTLTVEGQFTNNGLLDVSLAEVVDTGSPYTYTSSPIVPTLTVELAGQLLANETDYELTTNDNNINASTDSATYTITGKAPSYIGTKQGTFIINKKVGDSEQPDITVHPQGDTYEIGTSSPTALSVGASTPTDGGALSYKWFSNASNSNENGTPIGEATNATYTPPTTVAGTFYYYCTVTNTSPNVEGNPTSAVTSVATVTITKHTQNETVTPELASVTDTEITLEAIEGAEYAISTAPDNWQASAVFDGLDPNTGYTVYARIAETPTYSAGEPDSISVTTLYPVTVTWDSQGGTEVAENPQTKLSTQTVDEVTTTRPGYTFKGWYYDLEDENTKYILGETPLSEDTGVKLSNNAGTITLYAKWTANPPQTYIVTVNSGTGGGSFTAGDKVSITADAALSGKIFDSWTGGVDFADAGSPSTTFVMPANAVTVTANYKDAPVVAPPGSQVEEEGENIKVTLPDGGGSVIVPPGSQIEEEGDNIKVTLPDGGSVVVPPGSTVMSGENEGEIEVTVPGGDIVIVPPGSTVDAEGNVTAPTDNPPAVTGSWVYENGAWKYLVGGIAKTGWLYDTGYKVWFYLGTDGAMQTGWVYDQKNKAWYYLAGNGKMVAGKWLHDTDGRWYYLSGNGKMVVGKWLHDTDGRWYYLSGNGKMLTGKQTIGGKVYSFRGNGAWIG